MKKIVYLLGIILTILIGTYFFITCCSACGMEMAGEASIDLVPNSITSKT